MAGETLPAEKIPVRRRYELIRKFKEKHKEADIKFMCKQCSVSRSGYYSYLKSLTRCISDKEMKDRELVRWAYDFRGRIRVQDK